MTAKRRNITMTRGDTVEFTVTLKNADAMPDEMHFSVRKDIDDADYVLQKTLEDGIIIEGGVFAIRIAPEDTQELIPGSYVYDLELKFGDDVYTPLSGQIDIVPDVTRRPL